ncbi:hypothetical protein ACFOOM_00995 [Streptomyces echinoruber]|uniref:Uncharacterized protein n=1 Tax=Streptomyces echinoruber TaxID=68898 RepID=A0A918QWK9_9ACTN|nr:hypothetical protein [Streptomyces echinoruber]GGZ73177.1 hypothetical protein GCM10010389_08350 [Streptomyces echinoruber]
MATQPSPRPAYQLPSSQALGAAVTKALDDARQATEQLGRVMAVVTAAAVRDVLTGHQPSALFDAARLELVEGEDGSLFPTGRYWTQAGEERTFTETVGQTEAGNAVHDMSGWTAYLDDATRHAWYPLCEELPDRDGRPAYALDLARAAALTIDEPAPAEPAGEKSTMVEVMVCANDRDRYPALVDPADQRDGYVRPWFDLATVRRIAADTQRDARQHGHGSIDTVHVLSGRVNRTRHTVVLVVCWMWLGGDRREQAVEVLPPSADGRYAVGGFDWCWYALDGDLNPQIPFRPAP